MLMSIYVPDYHTLIFRINQHISVHIIRESVDMWRVLILSLRKLKKK